MRVSIKGFIYYKTAEKYTDCYDRFGINTKTGRFAVSDGVSKSFFPGIWAELLIDSFTLTLAYLHFISQLNRSVGENIAITPLW